jgi:5'(3')-deoxyribonucleotidase
MKNNNYILYLDLDGVMVDFDKGYKKKNGKSILDIVNSDGKAFAKSKYLEGGIQFWADLDWIHGGKELWEAANDLFETVCILSSTGTADPGNSRIVSNGKLLWLDKNIPGIDHTKVFIVNGRHLKKQFATHNAILVDDMASTIENFKLAGGLCIVHDSNKYKKTISELRSISMPLNLSEIAKQFFR